MKHPIRRIFALTASATLLAGLAACGGSDDDDDDATPPAVSVPQGATLDVAIPVSYTHLRAHET